MEGAATACAKVIATTIPIAMLVSDVFREMETRLFPGVREVGKQVGIIVIMRRHYHQFLVLRFQFQIKLNELLIYSSILVSKSSTLCVQGHLVSQTTFLPIVT